MDKFLFDDSLTSYFDSYTTEDSDSSDIVVLKGIIEKAPESERKWTS